MSLTEKALSNGVVLSDTTRIKNQKKKRKDQLKLNRFEGLHTHGRAVSRRPRKGSSLPETRRSDGEVLGPAGEVRSEERRRVDGRESAFLLLSSLKLGIG